MNLNVHHGGSVKFILQKEVGVFGETRFVLQEGPRVLSEAKGNTEKIFYIFVETTNRLLRKLVKVY